MNGDPQVEAVSRLSTATLHEAAGRIGALPPQIVQVGSGISLCGRAYPVRCPAGDNLWLHRAVYAAAPGDILVVDVSAGHEFGYWGEVLSTAAIARGLGGLVIDGGVRDCDQLEKSPFPVFSRGASIRGTVKDQGGHGSLGKPVLMGDVVVSKGDMVVGDRDGVVVIPSGIVDQVIAASIHRDEKEAVIMDRLRAGESTLDLFDLGDVPSV